jgi:hypothetical protein
MIDAGTMSILDTYDITVTTLAAGILLCGLVGLAIGQPKGRPLGGFILGALIGPIGWILVAAGPKVERK